MNNLCPPCITKEIKTIAPKIKSLIYINMSNNLGELIDSVYTNKNCRPNLYVELGNDNPNTASNKFSISNHSNTVEELQNTPLILPPELD